MAVQIYYWMHYRTVHWIDLSKAYLCPISYVLAYIPLSEANDTGMDHEEYQPVTYSDITLWIISAASCRLSYRLLFKIIDCRFKTLSLIKIDL